MIKTTLATKFIIKTEIYGEQFKYQCELLDEKRSVWECKFPRKMSAAHIAKAIEELFALEEILPIIIKFNFNGVEVVVRKSLPMCDTVLESIAFQLKVK